MSATDLVAEATGNGGGSDAPAETPFSMELSQDQKDIRDWAHGFAENVMRPAAEERDERE